MQLVGMLDSPYVRRVAVSLLLLRLPFGHLSLSVFRQFDAFSRINPLVKAPTLVCDDGTVLMDSSLILQHAQACAAPRSLLPADLPALTRDLRLTGLALAACEKAVQIVYERALRPPEKRHQPWVDRITGQMLAGFAALEQALADRPLPTAEADLTQGTLTAAVVWTFARDLVADPLNQQPWPRLDTFTAAAEALPAFRAAPHGDGLVQGAAA